MFFVIIIIENPVSPKASERNRSGKLRPAYKRTYISGKERITMGNGIKKKVGNEVFSGKLQFDEDGSLIVKDFQRDFEVQYSEKKEEALVDDRLPAQKKWDKKIARENANMNTAIRKAQNELENVKGHLRFLKTKQANRLFLETELPKILDKTAKVSGQIVAFLEDQGKTSWQGFGSWNNNMKAGFIKKLKNRINEESDGTEDVTQPPFSSNHIEDPVGSEA
jgi:hypothetical protein